MDKTKRFVTKNLIEFSTVMDTDLASMMVLLQKTKNTSLLSDDINKDISPSVLVNKLLFRRSENPFSVVLNKKYEDSFESIYNEFKDKYYDEVLEIAKPTDLFDLIVKMNDADGTIENFIYCTNSKEEEVLHRLYDSFITIDKIPSNYTCLFIKYISKIEPYLPLEGKYIYIINAQYNLGENFIPHPVTVALSDVNRIRMIDPYKGFSVPNAQLEEIFNGKRNNDVKK